MHQNLLVYLTTNEPGVHIAIENAVIREWEGTGVLVPVIRCSPAEARVIAQVLIDLADSEEKERPLAA